MRPLSPTGRENLLASLRFSAEFNEKAKSASVFGETAVQLVRGFYLYKTGQFLTGGVGDAIAELGLPFPPDVREILVGVEKAMRMEEDYLDMLAVLQPEIMAKITLLLRETLK